MRFYQGEAPKESRWYDDYVSEQTQREEDGRWRRREQRRRSERQRLQKHGAALRRVYRDAVLKRLRGRKRR